ncbi:MAG: SGNH/GDSL hydrolase family protein [Candidatus Daviesbacteria bacterium]|nr:MAG: SGNH/GDSL hydrolase family protein [Candidatus Daviesbacteria bacterium]
MKISGKVGLNFASIFFTILLVEVTLRIFWNPPYLNPKYQRDDISWLEKGVNLNKFGYRDRDFTIQKRPETYRIYTLGDSYTYGWYIDNPAQSFPKVLEKKLQQEFGADAVEVINAAKPGFNFAAEVERFENEGVLFNPDLTVIGINILDLAGKEFPPHFIKNEVIRNLKLYQITFGNLERARVARETDREIKSIYTDNSKALQKAEQLLKKNKKLTEEKGGELMLVVFPQYNPSNPNEQYKYPQYHEQIKKLAKKYNVQIVDLFDVFSTYQNKSNLVLNPVDPHPSALADKLAGEYIYQSINFKDKIAHSQKFTTSTKTQWITLGTKLNGLRGIISADPGWVFFDRKFDLGTQRLFLPDSSSRQVFYLEDILKTAKAFTHEGWVGAKIEYNLKGNRNLQLPRSVYGFKVVGFSKVTGFWREKGALHSQDLSLSEVDISKNDQGINIEVNSPREFELYKLVVDVSANQFDLENGEVTSLFQTKTYTLPSFTTEGIIGSLPKFYWNDQNTNFAWINNKMTAVEIKRDGKKVEVKDQIPENSLIEIPVAEESSFDTIGMPLIEYI